HIDHIRKRDTPIGLVHCLVDAVWAGRLVVEPLVDLEQVARLFGKRDRTLDGVNIPCVVLGKGASPDSIQVLRNRTPPDNLLEAAADHVELNTGMRERMLLRQLSQVLKERRQSRIWLERLAELE